MEGPCCSPAQGDGDQSGLPLRVGCPYIQPARARLHLFQVSIHLEQAQMKLCHQPCRGAAPRPGLEPGSPPAHPGCTLALPGACCHATGDPSAQASQRCASRWCCAEEKCLDLEQTGWFEQPRGSQSEKRRWKFTPGASQTLGAGGEERSAVSGMCLTVDMTLLWFIFSFELPNKSDTYLCLLLIYDFILPAVPGMCRVGGALLPLAVARSSAAERARVSARLRTTLTNRKSSKR